MKAAYEFAPGRLVLVTGERVRLDSGGALGDFDVLTRAEAYAAEVAVLRFAVRPHIQANPDALGSHEDVASKKRSGKPWTEEQYREAGIQLLHLRMRPDVHEPLDELAEQWGLTRGEAAKRAIAEAHARHVAPYAARRPVEQEPEASAVQTERTTEHARTWAKVGVRDLARIFPVDFDRSGVAR